MEKHDVIFKTKRLYARAFREDDLDNILEVNSNPEVMKYIGPVHSREDAEKYLRDILEYYQLAPGFGKFAVHIRKTGEFIGWVVLQNLDQTDMKEVGFRLNPTFWKRGFATEIAEGALEYGFWDIELEKIVAVVHPFNMRSVKVLEKIGMRFKRMAKFYNTDVRYYVLKQDQWERAV